MDQAPIIFMAGGGTGGHLYPGVAVAQALAAALPGAKCVFLCTRRELDTKILTPSGFEFIPQPITPPVKSVGGLLKFWRTWRETHTLVNHALDERKPAAVLGLGGYAAGVAVKLAAERKIPTAILNPDVIPGKANKFLMKHAQAVCCGFETTSRHVPADYRAKLKVTGCPIRAELLSLPTREEAAIKLELQPNLKTLVITGASQGAKTVNEAAVALLPGLNLAGWQVLHMAGPEHAESVRNAYRQSELKAPVRVIDFLEEMEFIWALADLAISRSGASTCAELTACGVPSILLPYPFHKDMHQRANAQVLADAGAAILVDDQRDAKKNVAVLTPILLPLLHDYNKLSAMSAAARSLGRPDAAAAVAATITNILAVNR